MIAEIYIIFELSKFIKNLELLGKSRLITFIVINNNEANRFYINDVNFFDSFYDNKFVDIVFIIKHFNKNIHF